MEPKPHLDPKGNEIPNSESASATPPTPEPVAPPAPKLEPEPQEIPREVERINDQNGRLTQINFSDGSKAFFHLNGSPYSKVLPDGSSVNYDDKGEVTVCLDPTGKETSLDMLETKYGKIAKPESTPVPIKAVESDKKTEFPIEPVSTTPPPAPAEKSAEEKKAEAIAKLEKIEREERERIEAGEIAKLKEEISEMENELYYWKKINGRLMSLYAEINDIILIIGEGQNALIGARGFFEKRRIKKEIKKLEKILQEKQQEAGELERQKKN